MPTPEPFVCFRSPDRELVQSQIVQLLVDWGFTPFYDRESILPGDAWRGTIQAAIKALADKGTMLAVFLTDPDTKVQTEELSLALDQGARVVPVLLPGADLATVPGFLRSRHAISFNGSPEEQQNSRILLVMSCSGGSTGKRTSEVAQWLAVVEREVEKPRDRQELLQVLVRAKLPEFSGRAKVGAVIERRWILLRRLGAGGFGSTWLSLDVEDGRRVVVKLLHEGLTEQQRDKFLEGGATILGLNEPVEGLARVIHAPRGHSEDRYYQVLEYVEGRPLYELGVGKPPLPEAAAATFIQKVGEVLSAMHQRRIYHCDVCPQNVIVGSDGSTTLIDYDLVRVDSTIAGIRHTQAMGKMAYLAPELWQGKSDNPIQTERCDVYSLGATAAFLFGRQELHHRFPEHADSFKAIQNFRVREVLKKACQVAPAQRYPSVQALIDALMKLFQPAPPTTSKPPVARPPVAPVAPAVTAPAPAPSWSEPDPEPYDPYANAWYHDQTPAPQLRNEPKVLDQIRDLTREALNDERRPRSPFLNDAAVSPTVAKATSLYQNRALDALNEGTEREALQLLISNADEKYRHKYDDYLEKARAAGLSDEEILKAFAYTRR